jgi:hypothetical protein
MKHETIIAACERLGFTVARTPAVGRKTYNATRPDGVRVYWSTSHEGGLLGAPRVAYIGHDTHIESLKALEYFTKPH